MIARTLRRATPADAGAIRMLTRAAYAKWVPVINRGPLPMTADMDRAVREHRVDLAFDGTTLVGLIDMIERVVDTLIENIAVDPAHQGCGIGKMLLEHAEASAIERGRPVLRLYTNARFVDNLVFYARRGFRTEREDSSALGLTIHMVKEFGRSAA